MDKINYIAAPSSRAFHSEAEKKIKTRCVKRLLLLSTVRMILTRLIMGLTPGYCAPAGTATSQLPCGTYVLSPPAHVHALMIYGGGRVLRGSSVLIKTYDSFTIPFVFYSSCFVLNFVLKIKLSDCRKS